MGDYIYTLPNATSGIDAIATQTIAQVEGFTPLILLFVFSVVALGGMTRQKARTGTADYPLWTTIGSIATLFVALLLSIQSGFINIVYLTLTITLTLFSALWYFLDNRASEV